MQNETNKAKKIKRVLARIKPYIKAHGGDVELAEIKGKTVILQIKGACPHTQSLSVGACIGCSLAELTYNKIVRDAIKEKIPEVGKVIFKNAKKEHKKINTRPVLGKPRRRVVVDQNRASNRMANQREYSRSREGSDISKIVVDRDLCIGIASCIAVAPATFELNGENKAVVTDPNAVDDETLKQAAQSCPTKAILLFDKEGKQTYP